MELTLLGTGTPVPNPHRAGPSQHLKIGESSVLVDVGNGTCRRMMEGGMEPRDVDLIFITHMHSDHTIDLAHVLLTGWIRYRKKPIKVIGPAHTREFVKRLIHAFEEDIKIRKLEERVGPEIMNVEVIEVADGGSYSGDGWSAKAVEVEHGYVKPALGFVFEEAGRKLMISGDTAPCPAIARAARDVDLLVHELSRGGPAADPHGPELEKLPPLRRRILESHTCPHGLAPLLRDVTMPKLVFSHLPPQPDEAWVKQIMADHYKGEVVVAQDLLRLNI